MKKRIKKGFTLAEVLITLTILGVVAALTIPSVMRTQNEAAERTKLKKAIVDYEKLISNMTIENDLTSIEALKDYANKDNCVKSRTYFKIKQDDTSTLANNCIFQTSNGVWWNVTDITRPVISTKGVENLSTADGENSFLLSTTYSDTARAFIVDDLSSSQLEPDEKAQLSKTFASAKIIKDSASGGNSSTGDTCSCMSGGTSCVACSTTDYVRNARREEIEPGSGMYEIYDSLGKKVEDYYGSYVTTYEYDTAGNKLAEKFSGAFSNFYEYDSNNKVIKTYQTCQDNSKSCQDGTIFATHYDNAGNISYNEYLNSDGSTAGICIDINSNIITCPST